MADDDLWPADLTGATAGAFAPQVSQMPAQAPPQTAEGPMGLSDQGLAFLKGREGWSSKAYKDYKQYSIGYGSKAKNPTEVIDEEEGAKRLKDETGPLSDWLNTNIKTPLTQQQHDALVSFGYNTGALPKLKDDLNAGNFQKVADRMQTWTHAGGKELSDLKDRRYQEGIMLLGGQPQVRTAAAAGPGRFASMAAAPVDDGSDLGSSLQQKPSLMGALSNPSMQAMLAGMAARLLTGGWGSTASNIGQSLGYGLEQAGNVAGVQHAQEQEQKKMDLQRELAQQHADTQLEVARMHGETMRDIAQTRAQTKLGPGAQSVYNKVYSETMKGLGMQIMTGQMDQATAHMIADQKAMESAGRFNPSLMPGGAGGIGAGTEPAPPKGGAELNKKATGATSTYTWDQVAPNIDWEKFKTDKKYRNALAGSLDSTGAAALANKERELGLWEPPKRPAAVQKLLDLLRPKGGAPAAPGPLGSDMQTP